MGIGVSNLGHSNPYVVNAIKEQLDKYMHLMVYGEYVQTPQVRFCRKVSFIAPGSITILFIYQFQARKLLKGFKAGKRFTGRQLRIIACHNSYHGSTQGALSVMGNGVKAGLSPFAAGRWFYYV